MITPSLGRVVWFTPSRQGGVPDMPADRDGRCAALVTYVYSDRLVNLAVFNALGGHCARTRVLLIQDGDPRPEGSDYCEWMPFQRGQAARAEAAEKELLARQGHP